MYANEAWSIAYSEKEDEECNGDIYFFKPKFAYSYQNQNTVMNCAKRLQPIRLIYANTSHVNIRLIEIITDYFKPLFW